MIVSSSSDKGSIDIAKPSKMQKDDDIEVVLFQANNVFLVLLANF